jgi:branched-chain amino acid transport system substrate-binding protein
MTLRRDMPQRRVALSILVMLAAVPAAQAEILGVALPYAQTPLTARLIEAGAKAALPQGWSLAPIEAGCEPDTAAAEVAALQAAAPDAIIGLPCVETLAPALSALGPRGVPLVTINSRAAAPARPALASGWPLARLGPREHGDVAATSLVLARFREGRRLALLDDGGALNRDFADRLSAILQDAGAPAVMVGEFSPEPARVKPIIDKLAAQSIDIVFLVADRYSSVLFSTEAAAALPSVAVIGSELLATPDPDAPLTPGILMIARQTAASPQAKAAIAAALRAAGTEAAEAAAFAAEPAAIDGHVAAQVALALLAGKDTRAFETAAGRLTLADDGFLEPAPYGLFRYNGSEFESVSQ